LKSNEEEILGSWLWRNKMNFRDRLDNMEDDEIFESFEKFLTDYNLSYKTHNDTWYENFEKLKNYKQSSTIQKNNQGLEGYAHKNTT